MNEHVKCIKVFLKLYKSQGIWACGKDKEGDQKQEVFCERP